MPRIPLLAHTHTNQNRSSTMEVTSLLKRSLVLYKSIVLTIMDEILVRNRPDSKISLSMCTKKIWHRTMIQLVVSKALYMKILLNLLILFHQVKFSTFKRTFQFLMLNFSKYKIFFLIVWIGWHNWVYLVAHTLKVLSFMVSMPSVMCCMTLTLNFDKNRSYSLGVIMSHL